MDILDLSFLRLPLKNDPCVHAWVQSACSEGGSLGLMMVLVFEEFCKVHGRLSSWVDLLPPPRLSIPHFRGPIRVCKWAVLQKHSDCVWEMRGSQYVGSFKEASDSWLCSVFRWNVIPAPCIPNEIVEAVALFWKAGGAWLKTVAKRGAIRRIDPRRLFALSSSELSGEGVQKWGMPCLGLPDRIMLPALPTAMGCWNMGIPLQRQSNL